MKGSFPLGAVRLCFLTGVVLCGLLPFSGPVEAITISNTFNFRDNRGPNEVGGITGDLNLVGAGSIVPSGTGTTATAIQGSTTLGLGFLPLSPSPNQYLGAMPFDPSLTGAWTITATDATGSLSVQTSTIPTPRLLPLVSDLRVVGQGTTPTVTWTTPDLTGSSVDRSLLRVWDLERDVAGFADIIFISPALAPDAGTFTIPEGVLAIGGHYSFNVVLDDLSQLTSSSPLFLQNRSETFTGEFSPVPEPATLTLLGTIAGLGAIHRLRKRARRA
jgi:hypothetical protein